MSEEKTVSIPHLEETAVHLGTDADCSFTISEAGFDNAAMLTLSDGGGFTGYLMSFKEWPEIRKKIDEFVAMRQQ